MKAVANQANTKVSFANKTRKFTVNSYDTGMQLDAVQTDGKIIQVGFHNGGITLFIDGKVIWSK